MPPRKVGSDPNSTRSIPSFAPNQYSLTASFAYFLGFPYLRSSSSVTTYIPTPEITTAYKINVGKATLGSVVTRL